MNCKRTFSVLFFCLAGITYLYPQTFIQPNVSLKSHETLEITKVELTPEKTVLFLTIENRIKGGSFCADRNIYLIDSNGDRFKLKKAAGIPECPDSYKFSNAGEKLQFTLDFPPLKPGTNWIDIQEECTDNCFSFYGVTLNIELNSKINEALSLAETGETLKAITLYKNIIENMTSSEDGIKGGLYTDIITLLLENRDNAGAKEWYDKMVASKAPRLGLYIGNLNSRGIRY